MFRDGLQSMTCKLSSKGNIKDFLKSREFWVEGRSIQVTEVSSLGHRRGMGVCEFCGERRGSMLDHGGPCKL